MRQIVYLISAALCWGKFVLVPAGVMVNVTRMKRILTLIALVGLAAGVFAGCEQGGTDTSSATNAPPAASTNK
jgi:hypothetical protein